MGHHHHHEVNGNRLGITIFLNVLITVGQVIGGILSGCMALLTDAAHNFSDVLSLVISYIANRIARKKPTLKQTFGFRRSEIIAAFANSVTLIVIALVIIYEAVHRLFNPQPIASDWVIWLALGSILLNGLSVLLIRKDAQSNINMKSALLHLFSDMLTSVGVLIGGLLMKFYGWYYADAIFALLIAGYLLYLSWEIFNESLCILMQFTPKHIDVKEISAGINELNGIKNIHHVHCWQLDDHRIIFEAHVDLESDSSISEFEIILTQINAYLQKFGINHVNIQPEYETSDSKELIQQH